MERPNPKILLAAFKSMSATQENVCEQMSRTLAAEHLGQVDCVVLDTGPNSEGQLQRALASDLAGVLLMHEDGSLRWHHFHIEDHAFQQEQTAPGGSDHPGRDWDAVHLPGARKISSEFAHEARVAVGATGLIEAITELGTAEQPDPFWCNRAYYHALEWGQPLKKPVLFVRVGISGAEGTRLTPLRKILELMSRSHRRNIGYEP